MHALNRALTHAVTAAEDLAAEALNMHPVLLVVFTLMIVGRAVAHLLAA